MTQNKTASAVIRAEPEGGRISKYIYGDFSEHLGRCIYDGFWVGPEAAIPNTRGIRNDLVAALRRIKIPVLRWPGGCFADEYHWQDGIGPAASRPAMVNTHWGGVVENNHFGTHEFLDLCEQLGCAPYVSGNVGSGTVREMQQWVEYLTHDGHSPMANLRRANGRDKPWKVRFWGIGNENWGCGGQMRPAFYADLYRQYATYCRNFGENRLYKIACGANSQDYNWTEVLMREAARYFDGLSLHYYTVTGTWEAKGSATEFDEAGWFTTLKKALFMDELVARHTAIMDQDDKERRVGLLVDEWGTWHDVEPGTNPGFLYQQNSLRDAMVAGVTLNILNRHCDRVFMANLAQTVNVLQSLVLTRGAELVLTPTYHVFEMYQVHQDALHLPVELNCESYQYGDEAVPAVSISASKDQNGTIHISLCNLNPHQTAPVFCTLEGCSVERVRGRLLTAPEMNAVNTFSRPNVVVPVPFSDWQVAGRRTFQIQLPAKSVVVAALDVR